MLSSEWPIVWGAIDGLKYSGGLTDEAVMRLTSLLSDPSGEARGVAAQTLNELRPIPETVIPVLVERLQFEDRDEVLNVITASLAASGLEAIPRLLALLDSADLNLVLRIDEVFCRCGSDCRLPSRLRTVGASRRKRTRVLHRHSPSHGVARCAGLAGGDGSCSTSPIGLVQQHGVHGDLSHGVQRPKKRCRD